MRCVGGKSRRGSDAGGYHVVGAVHRQCPPKYGEELRRTYGVRGTVKVLAGRQTPSPDFGSEPTKSHRIDQRRTTACPRLPEDTSIGVRMNDESCFHVLLRQEFANSHSECVRHPAKNGDGRIGSALLDLNKHPFADARAFRESIERQQTRLSQASAISRYSLQDYCFVIHGQYIDYLYIYIIVTMVGRMEDDRNSRGATMNVKLLPIGLIIASQVGYQLAQRAMPASANPFTVIAIAYLLGIIACAVLAPEVGRPIGLVDARLLKHWPIWALAVSVVGIELGYLLAYRAGWALATTTGMGYTATMVLVAVIGAICFSEGMSARRAAGLVLAIGAVWLLVAPARST